MPPHAPAAATPELDRLEPDPAAGRQISTRLTYPAKESGIVLEPVLKPVILVLESDQNTGWLTVPRDDDFLDLGKPQVPREVVLDLGECDLTGRLRRTP